MLHATQRPLPPFVLSEVEAPARGAYPSTTLRANGKGGPSSSRIRMTDLERLTQAANNSGSIEYSTAALAFAAALSPIASGTIWSR